MSHHIKPKNLHLCISKMVFYRWKLCHHLRHIKKSRILNSLLNVSGLVPSDIRLTAPLTLFNTHGLIYLTSLSYLILIVGLKLVKHAFNIVLIDLFVEFLGVKDAHPPALKQNNNASDTSPVAVSGAHVQDRGPSPIVQYVMTSAEMSMFLFNLVAKATMLIQFGSIKTIYFELMNLNSIRNIFAWSYNEIHLFLIILSSFVRRLVFVLVEYVDSGKYGKMSSLHFSVALTNSILLMFYGQEFQMEVGQFILIVAMYSVSGNLRALAKFGLTEPVEGEGQTKMGHGNGKNNNLNNKVNLNEVPWGEDERVRLVALYFDWVKIWTKILEGCGFFIFILFSHLILSFCLDFFIFCTASYDISPFSVYSISKFLKSVLTICKIICLGNASHYLQMSVNQLMERIAQLTFNWSRKPPAIAEQSHCNVNHSCTDQLMLAKILTFLNYVDKREHFQLSALQFFTISRSTLTTVAGVIVTYLVILIQFQSSLSSKQK